MRTRCALTVIGLVLVASSSARGAVFFESFDDATLNPLLTSAMSPGFSFALNQTIPVNQPGFAVLSKTAVSLAGPARFAVFLDEEYGSTDAHQAAFDDFSITADEFSPEADLPEPSSLAIFLGLGVISCIFGGRVRKRAA